MVCDSEVIMGGPKTVDAGRRLVKANMIINTTRPLNVLAISRWHWFNQQESSSLNATEGYHVRVLFFCLLQHWFGYFRRDETSSADCELV